MGVTGWVDTKDIVICSYFYNLDNNTLKKDPVEISIKQQFFFKFPQFN